MSERSPIRRLSRRSALRIAGSAAALGAVTVACGSRPDAIPHARPAPAGSPVFTRDDLVRAVETAQGDAVDLVPGTYVNDGAPVPLPEGFTVTGGGGATVRGPGFVLPSGSRIEGLTFAARGADDERCLVSDTRRSPANVTVQGCAFSGYDQAVALEATEDGGRSEAWTIRDNDFRDCSSGLFAIVGRNHDVLANRFLSTRDETQSIVFYGGQGNRITNNVVDYGVTGILFLANPSISGAAGQFIGNTVIGNTVRRCSEEHISFDCHGNDPNNVASFEQDTIARAGPGSAIELAAPGWVGATSPYAGYHVMINTGALAGRHATIVAQAGPLFELSLAPDQVAALRPGDRAVIGSPFLQNEVRQNTVDATERGTTASIALYGLCYDNTVADNTCLGRDLRVQSLNSLVAPPRQYTRTLGMAPTESNTIVGNTVARGATVRLDYTDFGASPPFFNHGNVVSDNDLRDGAQPVLTQQNA